MIINKLHFNNSICKLLIVFASFQYLAIANGIDSTKVDKHIVSDFTFHEVHVTASRVSQEIHDIPKMVYAINQFDIRSGSMPRSLPELLSETPGIMVQKTSHGQGSPYMRGFTGFRTLFLIDGVRLNNSVFRDGPNQYWNTVDALSIQQLEITMGANSSLYGSDAVGGVVNAKTTPMDFQTKRNIQLSRFYSRVASAEASSVNRVEIIGSPLNLFNYQFGFTQKNFGDLKGGKLTGKQPKTGYTEWDGDMKLMFRPNYHSSVSLLYQSVQINDAWRTHKTIYGINWENTENGNELRRDLDQARDLTILTYENEAPGLKLDAISATISYHHQYEEQYRIKSSHKGDIQGFDVYTTGFNIQAENNNRLGWIVFGVDGYMDDVSSFLSKLDTAGNVNSVSPQGPIADDAEYNIFDYFIQLDRKILPKLHLQSGFRYSTIRMMAGTVVDPDNQNIFSLTRDWAAGAGNLNFKYDVFENHIFNIFGGIAQSFRAPNLSDMTRFDSARSNEIEIPSLNLHPEHFLSYEIGAKIRQYHYNVQIALSYTNIESMIIRTPTGQIDSEGNMFVTKKNSGNGFAQSMEFSGTYYINTDFSVFAATTVINGKVDTYPTSAPVLVREPLGRLMPATGQLGFKWNPVNKKYWVEGLLNMADRQDKLSTSDINDVQRIPPGGTPGYTVFSFRSGYQYTAHAVIGLNIENVTNVDYRTHGSGLNQPGTNLVVSLDYQF